MKIRTLYNIMGVLSWVLSRIGCVALFAMMCLTVVDVAGRYLFNAPILGAFEMTEFMVLVMVFSFLGYAQAQKAHVTVDIFFDRFPEGLKHGLSIVSYLICLIISAIIFWMAVGKGIETFHSGEKPLNLPVPDYPFVFFLALGALVMCVEFLRDLIRKLSPAGVDQK